MTRQIGKPKPIKPVSVKTIRKRVLHRRVTSSGAWCMTAKDDIRQHYMVCAHPKAETAISLCWARLQKIDTLLLPDKQSKCVVCDKFLTMRKEVTVKDNQPVYKVRRLNHPIHNQKDNRSK